MSIKTSLASVIVLCSPGWTGGFLQVLSFLLTQRTHTLEYQCQQYDVYKLPKCLPDHCYIYIVVYP